MDTLDMVNIVDFALFAQQWLRDDCQAENDWCKGADLNQNSAVNIIDISIMASDWLQY